MTVNHSRHSSNNTKTLYVLDTNVFMHDPKALFSFAEHNMYIPRMVLRELDKHKGGHSQIAQNVRRFSRHVSTLVDGLTKDDIKKGVPLISPEQVIENTSDAGRLFFQKKPVQRLNDYELDPSIPDEQILLACIHRKQKLAEKGVRVILVSKDINMRIMAVTNGIEAEDYKNSTVIKDMDVLHTGIHMVPGSVFKKITNLPAHDTPQYIIDNNTTSILCPNEAVFTEESTENTPQEYIVKNTLDSAQVTVEPQRNFRKKAVCGITARNAEQSFAFNLLMNPNIHLVTIMGAAGSGKTLLTLAAGLEQTMEGKKPYSRVVAMKEKNSLGKEEGFLPGDEFEKISPWMGAFFDNLEVLFDDNTGSLAEKRLTAEHVMERYLDFKSINYMQGRTFQRRFLIIDEAQNLTPLQVRALITRAGPGTKVVFLGNLNQIITPYLDEYSSGLTFLVHRSRTWAGAGHVTLDGVVRSELAGFAEENLF